MQAPEMSRSAEPRPDDNLPARIAFLASAIALVGILLAALTLDPAQALRYLPNAYLVAAALFYLGVVISPTRGPICLLVAFFFLFFIALPAKIQIEAGEYPFGATYDSIELVHGYSIIVTGHLAFLLGINFRRRNSTVSISPSQSDSGRLFREIDPDFTLAALWVSVLLCVGVVAAVGPAALTTPRFDRGTAETEGLSAQLTLIGRSLSLFSCLLLIALLRDKATRRSPAFQLAAFSAITVAAVINYPPALPRFQLLGLVIALATMVVSVFTIRAKLVFTVTAPLFLLYGFAALKNLGRGGPVDVAANQVTPQEYLKRVDFDGFKQTVDAWIYSQDAPLRGLDTWIGCLFFWVPRSVWPGKPVSSGQIVSDALGYRYQNVSSPLPAEGFLSGGSFGVVVVLFSFGAFVYYVEEASRRGRLLNATPIELVACALLAGSVVIIMRGTIIAIFPQIGPAFLAYWIYWRGNRRRPLASPANRTSLPIARNEI